jgi:hypothetical protein
LSEEPLQKSQVIEPMQRDEVVVTPFGSTAAAPRVTEGLALRGSGA